MKVNEQLGHRSEHDQRYQQNPRQTPECPKSSLLLQATLASAGGFAAASAGGRPVWRQQRKFEHSRSRSHLADRSSLEPSFGKENLRCSGA